MQAVLESLAAWREAEISGLHSTHPFSTNAASANLPASRLTAKPEGLFVVPCGVPLDVEERVKVEADADLETTVAALRALSGGIRYTADARVHSHRLVSETTEPDENGRQTAVLRWKVVASWR